MLDSSKMNQISIWVVFILFFLLLHTTKSDVEEVRNSLLSFYRKLSNSNDLSLGWNTTSDPCLDQWFGVICDNQTLSVKKIDLVGLDLAGTFDASTLCNVQSIATALTILNLNNNSLHGENLDEIANCRQLTRLHLGENRFSGSLPDSLSRLSNLIGLDISQNNFSGNLPDLTRISGLQELLAQINHFTGPIPKFNFGNFARFNISFNNFTGRIPFGGDRFAASSYISNPELCGNPLPNQCPSLPPASYDQPKKRKNKNISKDQVLMFLGYFLIGLAFFVVIVLKLCKRSKTRQERADAVNKVASVDDSFYDPSTASGKYKAGLSKSGISAESGMVSSSLVVLTSPEVNGLKFDDLLKAPAELIGRGKHGTVYKVIGEQGMTLAVKRIRGWTISSNDFKQRMQKLDQVKHPNVLPPIAFYCSQQEKLLVYQYQENGSLFRLLHGTQMGRVFNWSSRLGVAGQNNGLDLARWVLSVVREEWTVEVFDKTLIQEGASEESTLNLLQMAVKCVDRSPEARPSINQVALVISTIKEEEERSIVSEL